MLAARLGHRLHLVGRRPRLGGEPRPSSRSTSTSPTSTPPSAWVAGARQGRLHVDASRRSAPTSPARRSRCSSRASASTPSAPARPTRRSPRPTRRCGSASAPTTATRSASRRRRRSSRPTRSCSCAATPRAAINGITMITDAGYFSAGITESFPAATPAAQLPPRPTLIPDARSSSATAGLRHRLHDHVDRRRAAVGHPRLAPHLDRERHGHQRVEQPEQVLVLVGDAVELDAASRYAVPSARAAGRRRRRTPGARPWSWRGAWRSGRPRCGSAQSANGSRSANSAGSVGHAVVSSSGRGRDRGPACSDLRACWWSAT